MNYSSKLTGQLVLWATLILIDCSTALNEKDKLKRANELIAQGNIKEANQILDEIIMSDSTNSDALMQRAKIRHAINDSIGMCNDLTKASILGNAEAKEAYKQYCTSLTETEIAQKTKLITDYIKDNPSDPDGYYNLGNAYFDTKNFKQAIDYYTTSIALNKNYAAGYYNRGVCYIQMNNKDSACPDITKAASLGYELAKQNLYLCK